MEEIESGILVLEKVRPLYRSDEVSIECCAKILSYLLQVNMIYDELNGLIRHKKGGKARLMPQYAESTSEGLMQSHPLSFSIHSWSTMPGMLSILKVKALRMTFKHVKRIQKVLDQTGSRKKFLQAMVRPPVLKAEKLLDTDC